MCLYILINFSILATHKQPLYMNLNNTSLLIKNPTMKPTTDAPTTTEPTMRPTNKPTMKPTKEVSSKFHMSWFFTQQYTLCVGMDMNFISFGPHLIYYTQQPIFNMIPLPFVLCYYLYKSYNLQHISRIQNKNECVAGK